MRGKCSFTASSGSAHCRTFSYGSKSSQKILEVTSFADNSSLALARRRRLCYFHCYFDFRLRELPPVEANRENVRCHEVLRTISRDVFKSNTLAWLRTLTQSFTN